MIIKMKYMKISLIYFLCYSIIDIAGLKLTEISIPKHIDLEEKAQLSCKFEITHGKLYSVKWYKDEFEFFRYMPDNKPNIQTFPVEGVYLDISESNKTTVTLHKLNFNSSGSYRCEVSKDGPNFETVVRNGEMKVMAYPKDDPIITGIQPRYSIGDYVTGNCTSPPSNPIAELSWYINNKKAESWYLEKYSEIPSEGPLYSKSVGVRFLLKKEHFSNGALELRCEARIADLPPWKRVLKIFPDNPIPDGIQAQNRLNFGLKMMERIDIIAASILLNHLYLAHM